MTLDELLVLVIEPSKLQRTIIIDYLREIGLKEIEAFEEAAPALERMQQVVPDIVVSSMHLPDMTGTDLVTQMRKSPDLMDVTFLLISSETHYRYLEPIRQAGAIAILPKPFRKEELATALRNTMHYIRDLYELENEEHSDLEFMQILIVDDSSMSRKYIRKGLNAIGIEHILEAKDGAEALQIMKQRRFDLVISDYNMPNIDGLELVEHIRHYSDQPTVPVMMVTSEQNESRLAAIQSAEVSAICNKPLNYDTLKQMVRQFTTGTDQ
ncbi:response regulator [Marinobacterium sediminicola]|uniref:Two-component system, chemotaxis family, response regulator CheY n=1 Tax=Marinobacterium sediminicola TaxID=518898 RepID=A0ABY1RWX8_9GAMM|nr:response regulator [Marinobacterium sediminicola]ULG67940.1 response regulator [Marinobacterium sediminicola]SMR71326.1 two-component system, chemotaxis family, response regulator CheY [Marinobacterium sediminicola]